MKALAFIVIMVLLSAFGLYGQAERADRGLEKRKQDTITRQPFRYPEKDPDFYRDRIPVPDLKPDIDPKRFHYVPPRAVIPYSERPEENYPGSERFYAKRPYLSPRYEKQFSLKPDPGVKYYLIIKDPLTNRVLK